jgi:hypothetical protein
MGQIVIVVPSTCMMHDDREWNRRSKIKKQNHTEQQAANNYILQAVNASG